ncbi:MAG: MSMEG_4193 family putative phosphomutase [Actinobacteria bacterium]|nr:MSMEG_4193 family putative phosphomutase [Actinomycetota bacterium]
MPRRPKPPPPTLALFVRHGRTPTTGKVLPGQAKGLHLAEEGNAQAEKVAERLAVLTKVDAIYASPLERTRETAAPIARRHGLKVHVDKGLADCDFGDWTGAELKALAKLPEWRVVQNYPSGFRFPGGESFLEMYARVVGCVERLRSRHQGGTVVFVSHADPIKAAVAHASGTHLDQFQRFVISPCSITAISYAEGGAAVLTVNSLGDLSELKAS